MSQTPRDVLEFEQEHRSSIDAFLPPLHQPCTTPDRPFVTLTFATSLDSQLALAPGVRTALSGPESKAMTHYLRSRHDAILIGVGTAIADDPGLNCRLSGAGGYGGSGVRWQPRPVVLDPQCRWEVSETSKILQMVVEGRGLAPWVLTSTRDIPHHRHELLKKHGGGYIAVYSRDDSAPGNNNLILWPDILAQLRSKGIESVMIEGGGHVINSLLQADNQHLIDSIIVTIAPTWLGHGGVLVSPRRQQGASLPVARLKPVQWCPLGDDVVLCGILTQPVN